MVSFPASSTSPMRKSVDGISEPTTGRLSVYLRCLNSLEKEGVASVSSRDLELRFHLSSFQIRKDLAQFGEFGVRGVGYSVRPLREALVDILGLRRRLK